MKRIAGIAMASLGVAALIGTAGCTKTSDGSIVLKEPSFSHILGFGDDEEAARIVPSQTLDLEPVPPPARAAPRRVAQSQSNVTIPSMSLADNPPFKLSEPDKPISCHNETSPTGRVRFVCS
jgi:hypothetical protein